MNLIDLINRNRNPEPWAEGEKIPWDEPGFSARMLREHLSQDHDAASRRSAKIDQQVAWIHQHVLGGQCTRVLDLACGPGLYASRLARLGHSCVGIDFSPASIAYAREQAAAGGLDCTYHHADLRQAAFGSGYGLAMLIFGEFNVFRRADAAAILTKAHDALTPGGVLLLEPHTYGELVKEGTAPPDWYSLPAGLFADAPYVALNEHLWRDADHVATTRIYAIDAATAEVTRYAMSMQAYPPDDYKDLLQECGFCDVTFYPSLIGVEDASQDGLLAIVARMKDES